MRIAYCIHSMHLSRGIERGVTFKANHFCSVPGNEVFIITSHLHGRPVHYNLNPRVKVIDIDRSDIPGPLYFLYKKKLKQCLESIRPDIAVTVGDNTIYALAAIDFGGKRVSEYHFSYEKFDMKYGRTPIGRAYAGFRRRRIAKAASVMDAFIVLTESDRKDWQKLVPGVRCIYNPPTLECKEKASLDSRTVIAAGALVPQKNYPDMLEAWKQVRAKHPDWQLHIYGDGKLRPSIGKAAASMFPEGSVRLMGRSGDMKSVYLGSAALVLSSRYEGFPMVLLEACECGVPAVSYDCPKGPAEIIEDGVSGFLVPQGDTRMLAEKLCTVIENEELRKSMGTAAGKVGARFSREKITSDWQALWDELLGITVKQQ